MIEKTFYEGNNNKIFKNIFNEINYKWSQKRWNQNFSLVTKMLKTPHWLSNYNKLCNIVLLTRTRPTILMLCRNIYFWTLKTTKARFGTEAVVILDIFVAILSLWRDIWVDICVARFSFEIERNVYCETCTISVNLNVNWVLNFRQYVQLASVLHKNTLVNVNTLVIGWGLVNQFKKYLKNLKICPNF